MPEIINNPSALLATHTEAVCQDILSDDFYADKKKKKNKYNGPEHEFFAPMMEEEIPPA